MGSSTTERKGQSNKIVIAVAAIIVILVIAAAAFVLLKAKGDSDDGNSIGYASDAKVMLDQNDLQAAVDEALKNADEGNIALRYKNNAYSDDGINFECSITNSQGNAYDMFLTIFADAEMTDQIYLSGLVPPGSGFENITLEHELEPGDHQVYVVVTQVDTDEKGKQAVHKQVIHTMDFHVTE